MKGLNGEIMQNISTWMSIRVHHGNPSGLSRSFGGTLANIHDLPGSPHSTHPRYGPRSLFVFFSPLILDVIRGHKNPVATDLFRFFLYTLAHMVTTPVFQG